jgi:hypothetical protein
MSLENAAVAQDTENAQHPRAASTPSSGASRVPSSCWPDLDALWFCYSPAHQFRYYYMNDTVDSCLGKIRRVARCFRSRLLSPEEAARLYEHATADDEDDAEKLRLGQETQPRSPEPVWELRPTSAPQETPPHPSETLSGDRASATGAPVV